MSQLTLTADLPNRYNPPPARAPSLLEHGTLPQESAPVKQGIVSPANDGLALQVARNLGVSILEIFQYPLIPTALSRATGQADDRLAKLEATIALELGEAPIFAIEEAFKSYRTLSAYVADFHLVSHTMGKAHSGLNALANAISEAWEEAEILCQEGEIETPNQNLWENARRALSECFGGPLASALSLPIISPMRFGRLSAEWHERGLNIEIRFRESDDPYVVIGDARAKVANYRGPDAHLIKAKGAIAELAIRSI